MTPPPPPKKAPTFYHQTIFIPVMLPNRKCYIEPYYVLSNNDVKIKSMQNPYTNIDLEIEILKKKMIIKETIQIRKQSNQMRYINLMCNS